ncbi:MAG: RNA ligase family protein [Candidatus Njordarchaeales archaeon]
MNAYVPINKKLIEIHSLLQFKPIGNERDILEIVNPIIGDKEYSTFNYRYWFGVLTQSRNSHMGTVISLYNGEPLVIRGYPKIKYAQEALYQGREYVVENKYDGTNLGCFTLPDGTFMCKTRRRERGDKEGYQGTVWLDLLRKCDTYEAIEKCCERENVIIFGELYGRMNPGEFVKYDVPIDFKVFDIVDRDNYCFVPRSRIEFLARKYKFNIVEVAWNGILTMEKVAQLEKELEGRANIEGFVAKTYQEVSGHYDRHFCKIKSKEIKTKCFKMSRTTIPAIIIREAVKKAKDASPLGITRKEFYNKVIEELREDVEEDLIFKSKKKITRIIDEMSMSPQVRNNVVVFLKVLEDKGYNMGDKRYVMRALANMFCNVKPGTLYSIYRKYCDSK